MAMPSISRTGWAYPRRREVVSANIYTGISISMPLFRQIVMLRSSSSRVTEMATKSFFGAAGGRPDRPARANLEIQ